MSFLIKLISTAMAVSGYSTASANEPAAVKNQIVIPLPAGQTVERTVTQYQCGHQKVTAEYWNAGDISLVGLTLADRYVVAANVIAASAAKYAGDRYIWWAESDAATLIDLSKSRDETSGVKCVPVN
ncbi:MliC family protein [Rhizobium sp. CFBP 8762]|uniref:MliC family protein n=1 Tax=Rhizobium sp. CFBP 8762 TaxID=2775279 RepID=UPI00177F2556|nr:MliC family protein [Rhizobium sp. CFBP 8762]MBD8553660.1 MliC family protein [Rhizobium sp. CFBP 8762]